MINEGKGPISVQDLINFMWSDKPLIELYNGRFEACFVIFHPFPRFPGEIQKNYIIATQNDYREKRKELSEDDYDAWLDTVVPTPEIDYHKGIPVTWKEVAECYGFDYPTEIRKLLNRHAALRVSDLKPESIEEFTEEVYKAKLKAWIPRAGVFEGLLLPAIRGAFLKTQDEELLARVFLDEQISIMRDDLVKDPDSILRILQDLCWSFGCIYSASLDFLFQATESMSYTQLYGSKNFIAQVVEEFHLEGFYCDESTMSYW